MIRRPPRSTLDRSSAASDVYKRQLLILLNGKKEYMAHKPDQLYRSSEPNEEDSKEESKVIHAEDINKICLLYTSPSPRDRTRSRMPSSACKKKKKQKKKQ
eukprot:TRINITY_DN8120_c0_g1_i3.p1 TRINITY_DN8120_c0_g1~~TRINITY_DN8120_c0_g1_i3.p1  ORF type:complete len:108 (-),score=34.63 TRINITY_DN8120_c0_g1_i3:36-338(-)